MNDTDNRSPRLLVILIAAVVQGWALYGLHWAIDNQAWPYTDRAWLFGLSAFWIFTPLGRVNTN